MVNLFDYMIYHWSGNLFQHRGEFGFRRAAGQGWISFFLKNNYQKEGSGSRGLLD